MLNLKHLYYYHIFAQELSTAKAAKRLRITSPALSNQLKQLEEFVGARLTRRSGGKVVFTEAGKMILSYAEKMFCTYEDLRKHLSSTQNPNDTYFRVGLCRHLGARFSYDLLTLTEKANMSLANKIQITLESPDNVSDGFLKDQYDLIIGTSKPDVASINHSISQHLTFPVRLFGPQLLTPVQEPMNDPTQIIEFANSKKISVVFPSMPSVLREETDRFLSSSNVRPLKTIECSHSSSIVQLIERGFSMGFAPIPCLLDFKSARKLTILGPPEGYWSHNIYISVKQHHTQSDKPLADLTTLLQPPSEFN